MGKKTDELETLRATVRALEADLTIRRNNVNDLEVRLAWTQRQRDIATETLQRVRDALKHLED